MQLSVYAAEKVMSGDDGRLLPVPELVVPAFPVGGSFHPIRALFWSGDDEGNGGGHVELDGEGAVLGNQPVEWSFVEPLYQQWQAGKAAWLAETEARARSQAAARARADWEHRNVTVNGGARRVRQLAKALERDPLGALVTQAKGGRR